MNFKTLRDVGLALSIILLLLLVAIRVNDDRTQTFAGRYRIVDGDSLALGKVRLRLLGIDAPELSQTCQRGGTAWPCGVEAKQALAGLSRDNMICNGGRKDKYGRLLVICMDGKLDINREMVLRGMAVSFGSYRTEEQTARNARAGLWAGDFAVPADWRRAHRAGLGEEEPHLPSFLQKLLGGS